MPGEFDFFNDEPKAPARPRPAPTPARPAEPEVAPPDEDPRWPRRACAGRGTAGANGRGPRSRVGRVEGAAVGPADRRHHRRGDSSSSAARRRAS